MPRARTLRFAVALIAAGLAIAASIALAAMTLVPGHDHRAAASHHCLVCQAGVMPCLAETVTISLRAPVQVTWDFADIEIGHGFDSRRATTAPRAPPV